MEIKTCEEYVLNVLEKKDEECAKLQSVIKDLQDKLNKAENTVNDFMTLFRTFGKKNSFKSTGTQEYEILVRNYVGYPDDDATKWYKWIEEKFPNLPGTTYGESKEDDE